jgi:hypothetical protein
LRRKNLGVQVAQQLVSDRIFKTRALDASIRPLAGTCNPGCASLSLFVDERQQRVQITTTIIIIIVVVMIVVVIMIMISCVHEDAIPDVRPSLCFVISCVSV